MVSDTFQYYREVEFSELFQTQGHQQPFSKQYLLAAASCSLISLETGWDLGPFAAVLQCLHLDTPLLKQQNTKKLKVNCMHAQLGQIMDKKMQKTKKTPTATLEEPGAKTGCWEQKQGTEHAPCTQHHLGGEQNT